MKDLKDITDRLDKPSQDAGFKLKESKEGGLFLLSHDQIVISVDSVGRTYELSTFLKGFHLGRASKSTVLCDHYPTLSKSPNKIVNA